MTDQTEPPIVELTPAPEILVDGYISSIMPNGIVRLTFFSLAHSAEKDCVERRIVLRMAASLAAIDGIQQSLGRLIDEVRQTMARSDP